MLLVSIYNRFICSLIGKTLTKVRNIGSNPNQMTLLLNKIERRLGLLVLNLPESISKDTWHTIIEEDTIPTFSRYFPYKITTIIDNTCEKDGFFFIDKDVPEGCKILGVKDIDWQAYRVDPRFDQLLLRTYNDVSEHGVNYVVRKKYLRKLYDEYIV